MTIRLPRSGPLAAVFALALGLSAPASAGPFSNLYVFGDSLSDNGNLYAWTDNPNPVTGGIPIPVPAYYAAGRFQNGPSYAELLWEQLGLAGDLTPSLLGGTNYAVGGARSRYHNFDLDAVGLPPAGPAAFEAFGLVAQFGQYRSVHGMTADPDALYVVWGGSNDIQDVLALAGAGNVSGAQSRLVQAVGDVASVVAGLAADGARQILVPTVPDLGLVPAVRAAGAQAAGSFFSQAFNDALDQALAGLAADPGLDIVRYDVFDLLREIAANPGAFGLANVGDPCLQNFYVAAALVPSQPVTTCGAPDEHLFWDIVHPSARTHEILAQAMREAVPEPAGLWLLGIGLAGLFATRRATRDGSV